MIFGLGLLELAGLEKRIKTIILLTWFYWPKPHSISCRMWWTIKELLSCYFDILEVIFGENVSISK